MGKGLLTEHLKNKKVQPVWVSKGRVFQVAGAAVANALRQEYAWYVPRAAWRMVRRG